MSAVDPNSLLQSFESSSAVSAQKPKAKVSKPSPFA